MLPCVALGRAHAFPDRANVDVLHLRRAVCGDSLEISAIIGLNTFNEGEEDLLRRVQLDRASLNHT